MPRQKVSPALSVSALPLEGPDVMEVLEGMVSDMAMDSVEAGLAPKFGQFRVEARLKSRVQHGLFLLTQGTV